MSEAQGFVLHPLAAQDITDIWEYVAEQNPPAASRVREGYPLKAGHLMTSMA
jgi:plasmid stabilization system protein ParE